jgi:hypothetical protein
VSSIKISQVPFFFCLLSSYQCLRSQYLKVVTSFESYEENVVFKCSCDEGGKYIGDVVLTNKLF